MVDLENRLGRLATMSPAQLRAEWQLVTRRPAPSISPDLLRRGIAYRLQEAAHGGLTAAVSRELNELAKRIARRDSPLPSTTIRLKPGTRLLRTWRSKTYCVVVGDRGFVYDDRVFPSLSPIAHEITGTPWSGPRFFGLRSMRAGSEIRMASDG